MVPEIDQQTASKYEPCDTIVLDYINRNGGALRWSEAVEELGISREQIEESVRRLMEQNLLKVNETSSAKVGDASQNIPENENLRLLPQIVDSRPVGGTRIYGCENCGWPIHTFPPDDVHKVADGGTPWLADVVEIKYICSRCREVKHLYWRRPLTMTLPMTFVSRFRRDALVPIGSFLRLGLKTLRARLRK